jgi:NTE family protein
VRASALDAHPRKGSPRVALALGSGGTRGFAHVGVLKTLHEAGIPIQGICGASAGALFGALYALEGTLDSALMGMATNPLEILGFYGDRLRLSGTSSLGGRLSAHFGETQIEALKIPMSILAVDLESGDEVLLREGSLLAAVEASIAIPVLARPVDLSGRCLIDGGYGQLGPVEGARAIDDEAVVVEVDLGVKRRLPSGLRRLGGTALARLRGGRARFVRARRAALGWATLLLGESPRPPRAADLVIAPNLSGIVSGSPFAALQAFERGQEAASAALPQLQRLLVGI